MKQKSKKGEYFVPKFIIIVILFMLMVSFLDYWVAHPMEEWCSVNGYGEYGGFHYLGPLGRPAPFEYCINGNNIIFIKSECSFFKLKDRCVITKLNLKVVD